MPTAHLGAVELYYERAGEPGRYDGVALPVELLKG